MLENLTAPVSCHQFVGSDFLPLNFLFVHAHFSPFYYYLELNFGDIYIYIRPSEGDEKVEATII